MFVTTTRRQSYFVYDLKCKQSLKIPKGGNQTP